MENQLINNLFQSKIRERLISLLLKFLRKHIDRNELVDLLNKKLSDLEYFEIFTQKIKLLDIQKENLSEINFKRGRSRLNDINKIMNEFSITFNKGHYLDIGCSDGMVTSTIGYGLGFNTNSIFATDFIENKNPPDSPISFKSFNGIKLNYPNNNFDFVTLFQIMHHIVNLDMILEELARVCNPKAIVIIREHDLGFILNLQPLNNDLYKLENALYDIVFGKNDVKLNYQYFVDNYYAKYHTKNEWNDKFKKYGFKFIGYKLVTKYNPTNHYYAVYRYIGIY